MTHLETQLAALQNSFAANRAAMEVAEADEIFDAYLRAVETRHVRHCRALVTGTALWCSCSRAHIVRNATEAYRQHVERLKVSGVRYWSSERLMGYRLEEDE